jgi:nitrile hydratase
LDKHEHPPHQHPPFDDSGHRQSAPASAEYLSAVVELLLAKGILTADEIRRKRSELQERDAGNGGRVVARAWVDPGFRRRLLADATRAVAELGLTATTPSQGRLVALENTPTRHHVVVCTLCSCYPTALLGPPPGWYRSISYRTRVVEEPRTVLAEFGLHLNDDVELVVVDSTADVRYLVLPRRPEGSEDLSEEELADLVTRDSLIGVGDPVRPALRRP